MLLFRNQVFWDMMLCCLAAGNHTRYSEISLRAWRLQFCMFFLCGCATWSLTLMEGQWLRIFDKVLRKTSGRQKENAAEGWENCTMTKLVICQM